MSMSYSLQMIWQLLCRSKHLWEIDQVAGDSDDEADLRPLELDGEQVECVAKSSTLGSIVVE